MKPSINNCYYQNLQFDPNAWSAGEDGEASRVKEVIAGVKVDFDPVRMFLEDLKVLLNFWGYTLRSDTLSDCLEDLCRHSSLLLRPLRRFRHRGNVESTREGRKDIQSALWLFIDATEDL